jgi:uncharacterized protein (TIGR02147 family)
VINIFDYTDYRQYLQDAYSERKRENPKFSYRFVASRVGFSSPGFFTNVLKGKKDISLNLAFKFADLFKLGRKQREYLELLLLFHKAGGNREKEEYLNRLLALRSSTVKKVAANQYEFYEKWYYTAVREALALHPFRGDFRELSAQICPPITVAQARKSIELLEQLGLIRKDAEGSYERTDAVISAGDEISRVLINAFQVQAMELAKHALDRLPSGKRNFSTLTLSISASTYSAMLDELREFRGKLLNSDNVDRVYQMNFQVFPLTALPEEKKP